MIGATVANTPAAALIIPRPHLGERRQKRRLALLRPVLYSTNGGHLIGELLDIGEDGMRLRTTQPPSEGCVLTVHLALPSSTHDRGRSCSLEGRVIWQVGNTVGLAFTERNPDGYQTVRSVLARLR